MPLIPNPTYAPAVVTSIKIVHDGGTNVIVSELPPGWAERQLAMRRDASEERKDSEECESLLFDGLEDGPQSSKRPRPPVPAKLEPKARKPF